MKGQILTEKYLRIFSLPKVEEKSENVVEKRLNCTAFVRQYGTLNNRCGAVH